MEKPQAPKYGNFLTIMKIFSWLLFMGLKSSKENPNICQRKINKCIAICEISYIIIHEH